MVRHVIRVRARPDERPEPAVALTATRQSAGPRTWRGPALVALAFVIVLIAFADRFGWHRDELYFVLCGRHLAWGYVDQPPLVPAIARLADVIAPGNLVVLRIPAALIGGADVLVVAAIAREIGGDRLSQLLAAVFTSVSAVTLGVSHLLSTEDLDVAVGLTLTWLAVRAVRSHDSRWLGLAAVLAGAAVLNKYLVALPVLGLVVGLGLTGHLRLLLSRRVALGTGIGILLALPNLIWQARHSWPELSMASALSQGNGTYGSRPQVIVLQLVLTAPFFVPSLIAGGRALWRRAELRDYRLLAISWIVVFVAVLLAGGKAYYDTPEVLALLAPGAIVTADWLRRGRIRWRTGLLAVGVAVGLTINSMLFLPVFPTDDVPSAVEAVNQDVDGMVGWPSFVDQVASAYHAIPVAATGHPAPALLTQDYSQAGALARFGPAHGLPQAYSGQNSMADFGRPPDGTQVVLAIGWDSPDQLRQWFASVTPDGQITSHIKTETDEDGTLLFVCRGPLRPWSQLWKQIRYIG